MINHPVEIKALNKYKVWLKYSDGKEGVLDLSHLANKGVFCAWEKDDLFNKAYIDPETGAIAWNETLELCPESLYERITQDVPFSVNESESSYATD
jgi:hypothetical protein